MKDYIIKSYALNKKRLETLNKTIKIQSRIISSALELDNDEVYKVINEYTKVLDLLDNYDCSKSI